MVFGKDIVKDGKDRKIVEVLTIDFPKRYQAEEVRRVLKDTYKKNQLIIVKHGRGYYVGKVIKTIPDYG